MPVVLLVFIGIEVLGRPGIISVTVVSRLRTVVSCVLLVPNLLLTFVILVTSVVMLLFPVPVRLTVPEWAPCRPRSLRAWARMVPCLVLSDLTVVMLSVQLCAVCRCLVALRSRLWRVRGLSTGGLFRAWRLGSW